MQRSPGVSPLLIAVAYLGFISLGLPDTLIGVAWPFVRDTFGVHQGSLGWVFIGAGCGYFLSSFCTGRLLGMMGIGVLLAASSGLVTLSALGFSVAPLWLLFVACSVLHGLGSGAIDAGLNYYVAHHLSARHMNWLHACYSFGATLGPLLMTGILSANGSWRMGYGTVGGVMLLLSLIFLASHRSWGGPAQPEHDHGTGQPISLGTALKHPLVGLQIALFFVYTGLEMTVGQWSFTLLTESRGISQETAGLWVTIYWGSIGVGRVLFGAIVDRVGPDRLVRISTAAAVAGAAIFAFPPSQPLMFGSLALIGLALAPIYPCLMLRTPQRLGSAVAAHAIGFQVSAATIGVATLPGVAGFVAQRAGLEALGLAALVLAAVVWLLHETLFKRSLATPPPTIASIA